MIWAVASKSMIESVGIVRALSFQDDQHQVTSLSWQLRDTHIRSNILLVNPKTISKPESKILTVSLTILNRTIEPPRIRQFQINKVEHFITLSYE